jgi:hypothetical protein
MRVNVYTEELPDGGLPPAEIVTAEYVSSRTGLLMTNYGLRVFLRSAPQLHYVPGRDDDRSAVTFWCGSSKRNLQQLIEMMQDTLNAYTLKDWHDKTERVQDEAEAAIK